MDLIVSVAVSCDVSFMGLPLVMDAVPGENLS